MSQNESIYSDLDKIKEELEKTKQDYIEKGKQCFTKIIKNFFEENPVVGIITWAQYIPYFNDGDPCEFTMNDVQILLGDCSKLEELPEYINYSIVEKGVCLFSETKYLNHYYTDKYKESSVKYESEVYANVAKVLEILKDNPTLEKNCIDIIKFISNSEEIMQDLFGEDAKIIITKDGIEVESYNHD